MDVTALISMNLADLTAALERVNAEIGAWRTLALARQTLAMGSLLSREEATAALSDVARAYNVLIALGIRPSDGKPLEDEAEPTVAAEATAPAGGDWSKGQASGEIGGRG